MSKTNDNKLSFLFSRLVWPSTIVRDAAARAIADLFEDPDGGNNLYKYLLTWISQQRFESTCFLGLIPLLYNSNVSSQINSVDLWQHLASPSIMSWMILNEIDKEFPIDFMDSLIFTTENYLEGTSKAFFQKHLSYYVPHTFFESAAEINYQTGLPFFEYWFQEWSYFVKTFNISLSDNMRYWMSYNATSYAPADTLLSEAFLSAFIRTIARLVKTYNMPKDLALFYIKDLCPIDINLWQIQPKPRPTWWPSYEAGSDSGAAIATIWNQVDDLWKKRKSILGDDRLLISFHGATRTQNQTSGIQLDAYGFFQPKQNDGELDLQVIADIYQEQTTFQADALHFSNLGFDGIIPASNTKRCSVEINNRSLMTAIQAIAYPGPIQRWQKWRVGNIWLPASSIVEIDMVFHTTPQGIDIHTNDSKIGMWCEWLSGYKERQPYGFPAQGGQYLGVSNSLISNIAQRTNSVFSWLVVLTSFIREKTYDIELKVQKSFRLLS